MAVEEFGKKLLMEVEEVGLDELLNDLRLQQAQSTPTIHFGLPQLDSLVQCMLETRNAHSKTTASPPIIELMSSHASSGKTQLLYHLTALAVLPTYLRGRQGAVLYFDLDRRFSVPRLAQQIKRIVLAHSPEARRTATSSTAIDKSSVQEVIEECLRHVQIYKPHTLAKTVSTLNNLQSYLFKTSAHHSFDRAVAFIAIDSASALYWQTRAEADEAALIASTSKGAPPHNSIGYTHLAAALRSASRTFSAPVIYTARDYNPPPKVSQQFSSAFGGFDAFSLRPSLPAPFNAQNSATLRLVIRKADIRKLPIEISVEDALREEESRRKVVGLGRFECFVNEWGVEEKVLQKLRAKGAMFEVFITAEGIKVGDGPE
ncbi:Putative DNA repair protein XRCC2 [Septoria linicola]|uniref:DNA repair protein XRCC2 n=1 Tax=Septoria linicola TaxID=215465 RepID=A0A9Q9ANP2_9PEZI|nr:putative DNA repair protein XRCC2 [Septoria linicola]USW49296.1 Putative DNA repair protein XRCC2 [Septoria linicola]